jgi:phosphoribosylformylglycinamidine cyclo-ligase
MDDTPLTYEHAGVSIGAQDETIARFAPAVTATHGPEVLAGVGAFGAAYAPRLDGVTTPVLVSSTDSVGTKTLLHKRFDTYEWAGRDIVGCVVNDVIACGARPLFFLDYLGLHKTEPAPVSRIVSGIAEACGEIGCALIGGELAEMRDIYAAGDFDLAGFAVGLIDKDRMLGAHRVANGDVLVGLRSNGVHCNGFSLARRALSVLPDEQWPAANAELGEPLTHALLRPTRCYANEMSALLKRFDIAAAAHISGGGLVDNVPRVIPDGSMARTNRSRIKPHPVFAIIQRQGRIAEEEMWHVFNMGIGFVIVVKPNTVGEVLSYCEEHDFGAQAIGEVDESKSGTRFQWDE